MNVILLIVPLVSIIFATIYMYNSSEFIELLLSQPVERKTIWLSLFAGLVTSLGLSFMIGSGIIILIFEPSVKGLLLVFCGILLSVIFATIAMFAAVSTSDKARGMGAAILLWLYFSIIFDGIVLFAIFQLADYPIEKFMVFVSLFNPIDMSRILMLMQFDVSALMGYTGAIFKGYFGTSIGIFITLLSMVLWVLVPLYFSVRKFGKKDL